MVSSTSKNEMNPGLQNLYEYVGNKLREKGYEIKNLYIMKKTVTSFLQNERKNLDRNSKKELHNGHFQITAQKF